MTIDDAKRVIVTALNDYVSGQRVQVTANQRVLLAECTQEFAQNIQAAWSAINDALSRPQQEPTTDEKTE